MYMNVTVSFRRAYTAVVFSFLLGLFLSVALAWCGEAVPQDAAASASGGAAAQKHHPIKAALHKLAVRAHLSNDGFERAEALFPGFCRDWQAKLRDRERNNVAHIDWQSRDGSQVGTYVGYGNIQSCTCKRTPKGIEIGKLMYQEIQYRMEGHTPEEARRATPTPAGITNTTEIFRYDNRLGKWIY
jgi:hypothetical protein